MTIYSLTTAVKLKALVDPSITEFAKRIRKKRMFIAENKMWAMMEPPKFMPEHTLARIIKEDMALRRGATANSLESRISIIEYRLFGLSGFAQYPDFETLENWLEWRLPQAHDGLIMAEGWTPDLYAFAVEDAKLSF